MSAHPTMVPMPTSLSTPTPATEVKSSGAEDPAAMNVAPATSSLRSSLSEIASSEGTKKSSQMIATPVLRWCKTKKVYTHVDLRNCSQMRAYMYL